MLRIHSDIVIKKMKECEVELMKRRCSGKAGAAEENKEFCYDCENLARISLC